MSLGKVDQRALALWAVDCAEHVLPIFETKYPADDRPRKAIEAGRAWARGDIAVPEARKAAFAAHAARDADEPAVRAAAHAAGHAAATAHVADHALHAAAYAVEAIAHASGTVADFAAAREREWQVRHLPESLRSVVFSEHQLSSTSKIQNGIAP